MVMSGCMINFAREIKQIRKAMGLNQADFAESIGASQGSVSKWERGAENPRTEAWMKIRHLYETHEGHRTASVFDPFLNPGVRPESLNAPVVGMIGRETKNDVAGGLLDPIMILGVPRLPDLIGQIYAWITPQLNSGFDEPPPGSIIFAISVPPHYSPSTGERVVTQFKRDNECIYELGYYGASDRGSEWVTPVPTAENKVRFSSTHLVKDRDKIGMTIVGKYVASFRWESQARLLLEAMTDDKVF